MLNKNLKVALLFGSMLSMSAAYADNHTFSAGYAETEVSDFQNLKGVNAQYRYEWNSPLSVMGSVSFQEGNLTEYSTSNSYYKTDVSYFSYLLGPAYRFNDYVSVYGLIGLANVSVKAKDYINSNVVYEDSNSELDLAYGAGLIINPTQNLSINAGYEATRLKYYDESIKFNGFNVGVGYRF